MLDVSHLLVKIAAIQFVLGSMMAWRPTSQKTVIRILLGIGLVCNGGALFIRYYIAWPMMPMYLGGIALPFCLGLIAMGISRGLINNGHVRPPDTTTHENYRTNEREVFHIKRRELVYRLLLTLCTVLALLAACFPKDFYLPFLKSATIWSHFFLWFGVVGKGCFLVSAVWAMSALWSHRFKINEKGHTKMEKMETPNKRMMNNALHVSFQWTVWGFAFWTLSMFAGELWSYLGWGTPVVWDEPAITTTMATWFFYICLLHLHLTGTWSAKGRGVFTASGAVVVLVLNCLTDLGPFRSLF